MSFYFLVFPSPFPSPIPPCSWIKSYHSGCGMVMRSEQWIQQCRHEAIIEYCGEHPYPYPSFYPVNVLTFLFLCSLYSWRFLHHSGCGMVLRRGRQAPCSLLAALGPLLHFSSNRGKACSLHTASEVTWIFVT